MASAIPNGMSTLKGFIQTSFYASLFRAAMRPARSLPRFIVTLSLALSKLRKFGYMHFGKIFYMLCGKNCRRQHFMPHFARAHQSSRRIEAYRIVL
jgi:hypothetical protein